MKIRYYIVILMIAGVLLYSAKDDVKTAYTHAVAYIQSSSVLAPDTLNPAIGIPTDNTVSPIISKTINTPEALRAAGVFLGLTSSTALSAKDIITLTNGERHDNGNVAALTENPTLDATAQVKLQDMFTNQYFEHVSPSGIGVQNLADQEGYQYIIIGENLALGDFKDDTALMAAWMASPGHRANILNPKYTDIGVAVGQGIFDGQKTWLAVQHFGLPKSACPSIDAVLHGVIDANQIQITAMGADMTLRRKHIDSGAVYNGMSSDEQISAYNALVETYNALVTDTKQKIGTYNADVTAFNNCISNNTVGMPSTTE
jgi:uncharacterized protein YkwD